MERFEITGNIIDLKSNNMFYGRLVVENGIIASIEQTGNVKENEHYILPGFVDAHIHIESSMVTPTYFSHSAIAHGTLATVSDPHEIANVLGNEGIAFMLKDAETALFPICFGVPSCVPATVFETAGAEINVADVKNWLAHDQIYYLSEMMNYPGVLNEETQVMQKIQAALNCNKPVDGHAPGLTGEQAKRYIRAGISTDHECTTLEEAIFKVNNGMKILIREGSAAKNFNALHPLIGQYPDQVMFCSDDLHPDDLQEGHINLLVKKAIVLGYDPVAVFKIASKNPVEHYKLPLGLLQEGDKADFIIINNLYDINILKCYLGGKLLFDSKTPKKKFNYIVNILNNFKPNYISNQDLFVKTENCKTAVIQCEDKQLLTQHVVYTSPNHNWPSLHYLNDDILKIVVVNRYSKAPPAVGFIKGFGLKTGALATSVAHDSHNVIAVGTTDDAIVKAVNSIMKAQGGMCFYKDDHVQALLPLPIAGIMSDQNTQFCAKSYKALNRLTLAHGCKLNAPFMTLSFMGLLVIPSLKLSDKGLFNGTTFNFEPLCQKN